MGLRNLQLDNSQLLKLADEASDDNTCLSDESMKDLRNAFMNNDLQSALESTLNEDWSKTIANMSEIANNDKKIEQIKSNQNFEQFKKSLGDIHKFKARVITNSRKLFSQTDIDNNEFQETIVRPYIIRDNNRISKESNNFLANIENNFMTLFDIYDSNRKNISIINNVLEIKETILFDIIANIQLYEQKNNVDVRNNLYQFERIELYNNIFNTLKIIYFLLLVLYIIFGNFMKEEMYKKKYFYIIAIIYIALPFMLKYIFAGIIFVYEYIQSLLGNNKQVLTYDDIVRANNIDNIYTNPVPDIRDRMDVIQAYRRFVRNPRNENLPFVNRSAQSLS